jgi:hypothetical protein
MTAKECVFYNKKHILLCLTEESNKELEYIKQNFCGIVFSNMNSFNEHQNPSDALVYFAGNVDKYYNEILAKNKLIFVVQEFSSNYDKEKHKLINTGQIPINIHNVGVFFKNLFNTNKDYFDLLSKDHQFQTLTESNKQSNAFRKGIYLSKVTEVNNELHFKLLRCSSNLDGPTDNFRDTDNEIINQVNDISNYFFEERAELNHVLAQIYENKTEENGGKTVDKKAKIKSHSDKTKDMLQNGLMAFCTFYKDNKNNYEASDLTKIRFKLKDMVQDPKLEKKFDIVLYPNSVLLISLTTNRLYTHEIVPSSKPVNKIPTRMGYVIRCSKTDAVFKNDRTYINNVEMKEPDVDSVKLLKNLYYKENTSDEIINYGTFNFSLNKGDYMKPII